MRLMAGFAVLLIAAGDACGVLGGTARPECSLSSPAWFPRAVRRVVSLRGGVHLSRDDENDAVDRSSEDEAEGRAPRTWDARSGKEQRVRGLRLRNAAELGQADEISRILSSGVPPDVRDCGGFTSLHLAADRGHYEACAVLIQKGASVDAQDGISAWTPLHAAAFQGRAPVVQLLVESGARLEARDAQGFTPLLVACRAGNLVVLERLLGAGVDVAARGSNGKDAFELLRGSGLAAAEKPEEQALLDQAVELLTAAAAQRYKPRVDTHVAAARGGGDGGVGVGGGGGGDAGAGAGVGVGVQREGVGGTSEMRGESGGGVTTREKNGAAEGDGG